MKELVRATRQKAKLRNFPQFTTTHMSNFNKQAEP